MTNESQHILVVEDDEMVQAFLALHLEIEGYKVSLASNGAEMLSVLSGGYPDLILLDLNLPDGDGLSLAQQVRGTSSIPIIIATARKTQEDRLLGLGIGADEYMTKPFDPKELILRIRNLLERTNPTPHPSLLPSPQPVKAIDGEILPPAVWPEDDQEAKNTPKGAKRLIAVFSITTALTAAIAGIWLFTAEKETAHQQASRPAQVFSPAPVPASQAVPLKTSPAATVRVVETQPTAPAAVRVVKTVPITTEIEAAPIEEDLMPKSRAELLGYGWVTSTKCRSLPQVQWWKYKTHESIAGYVQRKHDGYWRPYQEKWLVRLAKLQDISERNSSALTRTGVVLRGDSLRIYIEKTQKRLAVINCLAKEARQSQGNNKRRTATLSG